MAAQPAGTGLFPFMATPGVTPACSACSAGWDRRLYHATSFRAAGRVRSSSRADLSQGLETCLA